MARESVWYGQKAGASEHIKQSVSAGPKSLDTLVSELKGLGISRKNAHKALYAEVMAGAVTMSGEWSDGATTFSKAGA